MHITMTIKTKNKKDTILMLNKCFSGILEKVINNRPTKREGAVGGFFETRNTDGSPKQIIANYRITKE